MPALAIWAPGDAVTAAIAPLGLAAAAGTALVVDLDPAGPPYPGTGSVAALVDEGPRRSDLSPRRRGVAVMRNGGVAPEAVAPVLAALIEGWPAVVVRLASHGATPARTGLPPSVPVVPVRALFPGFLSPPPSGASAVYQRTGYPCSPPGPGPVLPVPRRGSVAAILGGVHPLPDRWVGAWRTVWRYPWV